MCSLAGDVMIEDSDKDKIVQKNCKKCNSNPSIVLRTKDVYCKTCFLDAAIHKFRAVLGKHRVIKPDERVLIIYKPGHSSTSLLHLIRTGLDQPEHKRLRFDPVILYIDEWPELNIEKRLQICQNIYKETSQYNYIGYVTLLHNIVTNEPLCTKLDKINENLFHSPLRSDLTLLDAININRKQLIINAAKQLNCKVVFTPDICLDVAVGILSNISHGRGAHLSINEGILDDRDSDVKILQPLRYFDTKEVAYYNIFNNIEPVHIDKPVNKSSSVQHLMKKFVQNLQENFPSTITTVVRTCDKLKCVKSANICTLCKAPIEETHELSSTEATEFSHKISLNPSTSVKIELETERDQMNSFCFACNKIVNLV